MTVFPSYYHWSFTAVAVLLVSTWSCTGSNNNEPVEFTVEVFPVTEEPTTPQEFDDSQDAAVERTSIVSDQRSTATTTTTTAAATTPSTTTTPHIATPSTTPKSLPPSSTTSQTNTTTSTEAATTTASTTTTTTPIPTTTTIKTTSTSTATTTSTSPPTTTEDPGHCSADPYCAGRKFPAEFYVTGHKIVCDQEPQLSQQCCLPQGKHLVCYNIMVDGEYLTFAADRPSRSTDYMELCDLLLANRNATSGPYSTISKVKGPGRVAYRYKEWVVIVPSLYRVKDIACMIVERPKLIRRKQRPGKTNKTTYNREDNKTKNTGKNAIVEAQGPKTTNAN